MKSLSTFIFLLLVSFVYSQDCTIDYSQNTPGIYPEILPDATAGMVYDEDATILFPADDNGVNYTSFQIISVELPLGLNWKCSNEANDCMYTIQEDAYACIQIYGTPAESGQINVKVKAMGELEGGATQSYMVISSLIVEASSSSTPSFVISPSYGCETAVVDFTLNNPLAYTNVPNQTTGIKHSWDFGNGQNSNSETPPAQTYNGVGAYTVTHTQVIDTTGFRLTGVTINNVGCTDIIGYGNPDIYIQVLDNSGAIVHSTMSAPNDASLPQNYTLSIMLNNPPYSIRVMDDDSDNWLGGGDGDDNCIDGNENSAVTALALPDVNEMGTTTLVGNNQSLNFLYVIEKDTSHYTTTSVVNVYANPAQPIIEMEGTMEEVISLNTQDLGLVYHWSLDGDRLYEVRGAEVDELLGGIYEVTGVNEHGCYSTSEGVTIGTSGVEDFALVDFNIYPNPTSNIVNVDFSEVIEQAEIRITDLTGKIVKMETVYNQDSAVVNVSSLASGFYAVSLIKNGQKLATSKLIVE